MRLSPFTWHTMTCALLLAAVSGCPTPTSERTNNQGGASLISVTAKLLSNASDPSIGQFNPDEWQIIADNLPTIAGMVGISVSEGTPPVELSDEDAQLIVDFLRANGVTKLSDLTLLAGLLQSGELVVPDTLRDLVRAMGFSFA